MSCPAPFFTLLHCRKHAIFTQARKFVIRQSESSTENLKPRQLKKTSVNKPKITRELSLRLENPSRLGTFVGSL